MFSGQASILFEMVCVDSSLLGNGMVHGFAKNKCLQNQMAIFSTCPDFYKTRFIKCLYNL